MIFMTSCVTPYYPDITKYENLFVVDGELTNLTGPYKVKLSRTYKYDGSIGEPVTGAKLKITDNTGSEVLLKEINSGEYSTVDTIFRGIPGKSYKLQIRVNEDIFESDFETLKTPAPLDKVYWDYKQQDKNAPKRVQILIDTQDPTNNTRYYGWEYEETWKFRVPIDFYKKPEWKICFKSDSNKFFILGTSIERNSDKIEGQPLKFIDETTNRLFIRYTILTKQYSFTEKTYTYFKDLIKLNHDQGTLFDATPYSLVGNIKNLNNKDVPVLGYFVVAGVSQKRIFIDRLELPEEFNPTDGFNDCLQRFARVDTTLKDFRLDRTVDSLMNVGYIIYQKSYMLLGPDKPGWQLDLAKPPCLNCTLTGESKIPYFWTEKK